MSEEDCSDRHALHPAPKQALRSRRSTEEVVREAARQARALARQAPAAAELPPTEATKVSFADEDRLLCCPEHARAAFLASSVCP